MLTFSSWVLYFKIQQSRKFQIGNLQVHVHAYKWVIMDPGRFKKDLHSQELKWVPCSTLRLSSSLEEDMVVGCSYGLGQVVPTDGSSWLVTSAAASCRYHPQAACKEGFWSANQLHMSSSTYPTHQAPTCVQRIRLTLYPFPINSRHALEWLIGACAHRQVL